MLPDNAKYFIILVIIYSLIMSRPWLDYVLSKFDGTRDGPGLTTRGVVINGVFLAGGVAACDMLLPYI